MKTAQLFADQFTRVTTGSKALYGLKNGITLEAVKGIMKLEGFGDASETLKDNRKDFQFDIDEKFVKRVHYWCGDVYRPTVKGCKVIFNLLTNGN